MNAFIFWSMHEVKRCLDFVDIIFVTEWCLTFNRVVSLFRKALRLDKVSDIEIGHHVEIDH